jgi:flagellar biosynthetic protein FliP
LVCVTSFTRIVVVLAFARQAMGTQQTPPNQVIIGIALFLTLFTMGPTAARIHSSAVEPYLAEEITEAEAFSRGVDVLKRFMLHHTRRQDLALFFDIADAARPASATDVPLRILVPAFVVSELKTAFQIGFLIFVPFLLIDLVVSSILMAMGMMMLPPVLIALPFKILLFVLVDGWYLLVGSVARSFA